MSKRRGILDEVRALVDKGGEVSTKSLEIRAKLVAWGGAKGNFPEEHPWAAPSLERRLVNLFRKHGIDLVLIAIEELEEELEAMGLELPDYYRRNDRRGSKFKRAFKIACKSEKRWAREREGRNRGWSFPQR